VVGPEARLATGYRGLNLDSINEEGEESTADKATDVIEH
jgi:hypothetical protein